jgi:hypothetical protein
LFLLVSALCLSCIDQHTRSDEWRSECAEFLSGDAGFYKVSSFLGMELAPELKDSELFAKNAKLMLMLQSGHITEV